MTDLLKSVALFSTFPGEMIAEITSFTRRCAYRPGETIFREGDAGADMFVIEQGEVEIRKQGRVLAVFDHGEIFGEMVLFESAPRSADAVARTACEVALIDTGKLKACLRRNPAHSVRFYEQSVEEISRRLRITSQHLVMVFESGKIVGKGLGVENMCEGIVSGLMRDIPGATGGVVLTLNPFTGGFEETWRTGMAGFAAEGLILLAGKAGGKAFGQMGGNGVFLGVPMEDGEKNLGWIFIEKQGRGARFTMEERVICETVGNQVGFGIVSAYGRREEEARRRLERNRMRGYKN